ncbi:tetratricopeptide repeat protein [Geomonas sp. Red32]|uniref:tetratricopeptide repeat protein n=1 Tax=Geomonas sp. Red32 TaxID=2912856 RepID=UPI00202CAAF3|nr:tetratricopeptide repeat protein [Geomonas sp. Red32]MCM0081586.1 tetratricopeptide repeat protein [Geomonas sp. Red32]
MSRWFLVVLIVPLLLGSGCAMNKAEKNTYLYHYQMGQSFYAENNFTGALQEFTEAEKISAKEPELLNLLGLAYFRKGLFELAEKKYLRALKLKENYSEARNNLGVDYLEMKRWDAAIAQFKQVQEDIFYADQGSAAINLGLAYFGKGDYDQALAELRGSVSKNPSDPRARLNLGRVYFALNRTELAIEQYKKAVSLNSSYAAAYYHLGLAYMKQNESREAREAFREVVKLAPDSENGQLSREYLDMLK